MNVDILTKLLWALFLLLNFFIIPLLSGIIGLIRILTFKNKLKKAGKYYFVLKVVNSFKNYKILLILGIILLICSIFILFFTGESLLLIISLTIIIWWGSEIIIVNLYGNNNGIYENGIIYYDIIFWKEIHSYKIDGKDISGYYRKDNLFEFKNIENINAIRELFEGNKIREK